MNDPKGADVAYAQAVTFKVWVAQNVLGVFTAQLFIALAVYLSGLSSTQEDFGFLIGMIGWLSVPTCIITFLSCLALNRLRRHLNSAVIAFLIGLAGFLLAMAGLTAVSTIWTWPIIDWLVPMVLYWPFGVSFFIGAAIAGALPKVPRIGVWLLVGCGLLSLAFGLSSFF